MHDHFKLATFHLTAACSVILIMTVNAVASEHIIDDHDTHLPQGIYDTNYVVILGIRAHSDLGGGGGGDLLA